MSTVTASLFPEEAGRAHEEEDLQVTLVAFLQMALPSDAVVFHVPNGGLRSKKAAGRLKAMGTVAGVPDLCVIWRGRVWWIELKSRRGGLNKAQREMVQRLVYCGCEVLVAKSIEAVEQWLRSFQIPLRGRLAA